MAECPECGNPRGLFNSCPHCGSLVPPHIETDAIELNIKFGNPTVEEALDSLAVKIREVHELGIKAIVLIHGYGSSGEGGHIKRAVHEALSSNRYADRVEEYFFGEMVPYGGPTYQSLIKRRPNLKRFLKHFKSANVGMTVLLLSSDPRSA